MGVDIYYIIYMAETTEPKQLENSARSDFPKNTFEEALKVSQAIEDSNGGNPLPPQEVAIALKRGPGSSDFRVLLSSSIKYGLTIGSFNSQRVSLTDIGRDIVEPKDDTSRNEAVRSSILKPSSFTKVFEYYKGKKVPEKSFFENTLARDFEIPKKQAGIFVEIFMANIKYLGLIKEATTGSWFASEISSASHIKASSSQGNEDQKIDSDDSSLEEIPNSNLEQVDNSIVTQPKRPNAIFLGHGQNQKPLDQLIKILNEYSIPHKEAVGEANAGRPIPTKVADTMRECGAAILIFTADEKFQDQEGKEILRPSENVVHELGAAAVLYDNRIIIFKEDGVSLASNFSGIGYIPFEKDKLGDKAGELLRELIKFKLLSFTVGG